MSPVFPHHTESQGTINFWPDGAFAQDPRTPEAPTVHPRSPIPPPSSVCPGTALAKLTKSHPEGSHQTLQGRAQGAGPGVASEFPA